MLCCRPSLLSLLARSQALPQVFALPLLLALPLLSACESDSLKPPVTPAPSELYWALELDHHAVTLDTLAPYNTLRLTATPRNAAGEPLAELPAPQYFSRDFTKVEVTAEGLLVAKAPTSGPVWVLATLTVANLKHQDSALVKVTALDPASPRPVLARLSVQPLEGDSAKAPVDILFSGSLDRVLPVRATTADGVPLDAVLGPVPVYFRSSDRTTARVGPWEPKPPGRSDNLSAGQIAAIRPGSVTFYANTTVFGVTKVDTIPYRVGWPVFAGVDVTGPEERDAGIPLGTFLAPEMTVGEGAVVGFGIRNLFQPDPAFETDVVFAEADVAKIVALTEATEILPGLSGYFCFFFGVADCGVGDIVLGPSFTIAWRVFPEPGTYEYHSPTRGTRGRIVVVDER
jgi:hypothetical protein